MICVGEQLAERQSGRMQEVLTRQVRSVICRIHKEEWSRVVIAYEPVWAIGTGVVATPLEAQEAHYMVRTIIADQCGRAVARSVRILYGGSVSPANCASLGELPDVDGFLVGGASTKPNF